VAGDSIGFVLNARKVVSKSNWVFPGGSPEAAILGTSIDHPHEEVRDTLKLSKEFVVHSLRHTMLTCLGEAGADAFTIVRIAGHSSVTVSQRYVHPTPEGMERAFERLQDLNTMKFARAEAASAGAETPSLPAKVPTSRDRRLRSKLQAVEIAG
jgi:integrase